MEDKTIGFWTKVLFPEYEDMDTEELGRRVREKYPNLCPSEPQVDEVLKTTEELHSYSNTKRGPFTSRWILEKSVARVELDRQLVNEIDAKNSLHATKNTVIQMDIARRSNLFAQKEAQSRFEEGRRLEKALHQNELKIAQNAAECGLDRRTYLLNQDHRLRLGEQIKFNEEQAKIDTDKHREMEAIEVEMDMAEKLNTLNVILQYKHMKYAEFDEVANRLITLIKEENELAKEPYNEEALGVIRERKQTYQALFRRYQQDLVETGDREIISGLDALTDSITGGESGSPADEKQIPAKKSRGRPRKHPTE